MIGLITLLGACQKPEIDPPVVVDSGSGVDALIVTVPDSGDASGDALTVDGSADEKLEASTDGNDAAPETSDAPALPDVTEVAPEVPPPPTDAQPIGPCPAGYPPLPATEWTATASAQAPGDLPAKAYDGRLNSRWSTGTNAVRGQWFRLDLGGQRSINRFQLDTAVEFVTDFPHGYTVELSTDDATYHEVSTGTGAEQLTTVSFPVETARYLKITLTTPYQHWWGIAELVVCGR